MKSVLTAVIFFFLMTCGFAAGTQQLKGSNVPKEALQYPIGPMSPDKRLHLAIQLPVRNQDQRDQLLQSLYDPKSPNYGHYLTPQEYAERFGASQADYDRVVAFFKGLGFQVTTSSNRLLLDVDGTVSMIEATFHTTLRLYKHPTENRNFYAPDAIPSIDLEIPIAGVFGLDDFIRFHPAGGGPHAVKRLSPN